jgi:hypothetical protein
MDNTYWNKAYDGLNTVCPKCKGLFNSRKVKIKDTIGYEGITVYVFDCPCCGQEIDDLQCDGVEKDILGDVFPIKKTANEDYFKLAEETNKKICKKELL